MKRAIKVKWIEALRSRKYRQGKGCLLWSGGYCCLGVLCHVVDPKMKFWEPSSGKLPRKIATMCSCKCDPSVVVASSGVRTTLSLLNDEGTSFKKIANLIEEQL